MSYSPVRIWVGGEGRIVAIFAILRSSIFPANAKAAREGLTIGGRPVPKLGPHLAIQAIFIGALLASV